MPSLAFSFIGGTARDGFYLNDFISPKYIHHAYRCLHFNGWRPVFL